MKRSPGRKLHLPHTQHDSERSAPLLEVVNVFRKGEEDFVVRDISFTVNPLEKIAIAGETGAGKSTVLKLIAGLVQPDGGVLRYEGRRVLGPDDQLVPGHPGIAYLSQQFELQKSLRVEQVLEYSNALADNDAERLYDVCQITHLLRRRTDQLSGGEKQRVAICRLLISRPGLLLLDEPFSHLDMVHKNTLKSVIRDIGEKLRITCMLVSHDPADTLPWADRIVVMREGQIVQVDKPAQIYHRPVNAYTAGLFGKCNFFEKGEMRRFAKLSLPAPMKAGLDDGTTLLRPEQFKIVRKSDRALRARVERVMFYGSFCEAEVSISKRMLTIRTGDVSLRPGDIVFLTIRNVQL